MSCSLTLDFTPLSPAAWTQRFDQLPRSTLTQSYEYAQAMAPLLGALPRWALLRKSERVCGLVQLFETRLAGGALHTLQIDRGPLWDTGHGTEADINEFAQALDTLYPRRLGRRRRWIPEHPADLGAACPQWNVVPHLRAYQTLWLDLTQTTDALNAQMRKGWRQSLAKARRVPQQIAWDHRGGLWQTLAPFYAHDRAKRRYRGASVRVLNRLASVFGAGGRCLTGVRYSETGDLCAGVCFFIHGSSATYQIGYADATARTENTLHRLMWEGIAHLQAMGVRALDLGGIHDDAPGLTLFKTGIGGVPITYARARR